MTDLTPNYTVDLSSEVQTETVVLSVEIQQDDTAAIDVEEGTTVGVDIDEDTTVGVDIDEDTTAAVAVQQDEATTAVVLRQDDKVAVELEEDAVTFLSLRIDIMTTLPLDENSIIKDFVLYPKYYDDSTQTWELIFPRSVPDMVGGILSNEFVYDPDIPLISLSSISADKIVDGVTNKAFTALLKEKLDTIETGAQVNVKADWAADSGEGQILNRPVLGTAASEDIESFATASQGELASTAIQPGDSISSLVWTTTNW